MFYLADLSNCKSLSQRQKRGARCGLLLSVREIIVTQILQSDWLVEYLPGLLTHSLSSWPGNWSLTGVRLCQFNVGTYKTIRKPTRCNTSNEWSLLFINWLYMFRTITSPSSGASSHKLYSALVCSCYQASLAVATQQLDSPDSIFIEAESTPGTWTCQMLRKKIPRPLR